MKMKFAALFTVLFVYSSLKADIEIKYFSDPTTSEDCDGTITVDASGEAGPFTLTLKSTVEGVEYTDKGEEVNGSYTFTGLCNGNYTIAVENAFMCLSNLGPITLRACEAPAIEYNIKATSCTDEGVVQLFIPNSDSEKTYLIQWNDGFEVNASSNESMARPNLPSGNYCVTVTDNECNLNASKCFQLGSKNPSFEVVLKDIELPNTQSDRNGRLETHVDVPGNFTYEWDNGTNGPVNSNLSSGLYTVTVTDEEGCQVEKTFELTYCVFDPEEAGEIEPGDEPTSDESAEHFQIKIEGDGIVFTEDELVDMQLFLKEEGQNDFTSQIPSYYTIEWELPPIFGTHYEPSISEPLFVANPNRPGEFSIIKVRVSVSNGCSIKTAEKLVYLCNSNSTTHLSDYQSSLLNNVFNVKTIQKPCQGFSDGEISLEIPNPNTDPVILELNGIDYSPSDNNQELIQTTITDLPPGTHSAFLQIGSCEINFNLTVESKSFTNEFLRLEDDDKVCVFDQKCNDIELGVYRTNSEFEFEDANNVGLLKKCEVPILCDDIERKKRRYRGEKMTFFRYQRLIDEALATGIIGGDYHNQLFNFTMSRNLQHCDKVKVCPVNFQLFDNVHVGNVFRGRGDVHNLGGGCWGLNCQWPAGDDEFCRNDLLSGLPHPELQNPVNDQCSPYTESLFWLYYNDEALLETETYGDLYRESSLRSFILEYGWRPEAKCTRVTYCTRDFSKLHDNFDEVNCGRYLLKPVFLGCRGVVCGSQEVYGEKECDDFPIEINGELRELSVACGFGRNIISFYKGTNLIRVNGSSDVLEQKVLKNPYPNEQLKKLSTTKSDGMTVPKGIIASQENTLIDYYSHSGTYSERLLSDNFVTFIDDWDTNQEIAIEALGDENGFMVDYLDSLISWQHVLSSDNYLRVEHLSKTEQLILVAGSFRGAYNFDGLLQGTVTDTSIFVLKMDFYGNISNFSIIEGIVGEPVLFETNSIGDMIIGGMNRGQNVQLDNQTLQTNGINIQEGIVLIKLDTLNHPNVLSNITYNKLQVEPIAPLKLLSIEIDDLEEEFGVFLKEYGTIDYNGVTQFYERTDSNLVLVNIGSNRNINYLKVLGGENIDDSNTDLTFSHNESNPHFVLGLTFENSFQLEDSIFTSNGNKDILVFKLDQQGNVKWVNQYGTIDEESITELFYDNEVVFFGGVFSGPTKSRELGNYVFYNDSDLTDSKAYISYIFDEDYTVEQNSPNLIVNKASQQEFSEDIALPSDQIQNKDEQEKGLEENLILNMYPNPFKNRVSIILYENETVTKIEIINPFGSVIFSKKIAKGNAHETVDLSRFQDGIYYVKALNEAGEIVSSQKLIRMD